MGRRRHGAAGDGRCRRDGRALMTSGTGEALVVTTRREPAPAPAVDLTTRLGPTDFPNPIFTASGCAAAGRELDPFLDVSALGGIVTKSIMLKPRSGRATPRMAETPSGMLNSIGLQG